ncbi:hypothetical protein C8F04DRAFT_1390094 [Mycena alexandri]|uniref:Uncharacterized protein n=1 Tax=Mycena alexandri TaxID=1745969 RepID=A0AAD6TFE1_9AGAR|nr:hypothetical protein C8F04DRAFT_1390094 [Mycena alexandri]
MSTMLYDAQPVDAHMVDYPIDIDMQNQEPWFDAEAKMDDDVPQNHFTDHDSSLSVEVDMDDHYAEKEYEMGEGEENYEEMSSDLLDIEVYDASEPLEDATLPPADVMEPADAQPFDIDSPETAKPLLLPVAATPAMSPLPPSDTDLPDAVASEHAEAAAEEPVDEGSVNLDAPVELSIPLPDDETVETSNRFQNHESDGEQERVEAGFVDVPQAEEQNPSSGEHRPSSDNENHDVEDPTATDPHEISEGVYIDPPPAVLVSFESSDFPDICLFNQPARSRSPSPSTDGRDQGYQVFDLLLHHHPILYYEPLASVFEALRQEEYLTRISHLVDSELVLDAYDLQLVISEDNVYAREVTLHDLNVLHDGTDVSGPLRLRLRSVIPRFIHRYHQLQAQVSRLNLVAAGDEQEPVTDSTERAPNPSESNQQDQDEPQAKQVQGEADENTAGSNENPPDASESNATPKPTEEEQHEAPEEPETETETAAEPEHHPGNAQEGAENNIEATAGDDDGGYGEKLQHEELDTTETADLPEPPEEDDEDEEQEEEFVVVETPGAKPLIPLTGTAPAEDIGNELETTLDPLQSSGSGQHEHDSDLAPPDSETRNDKDEPDNANNEDATGVLANDSLDPSVHDDDIHEGESYDDEEPSWEDAIEGDEDPDTTWEADAEHETASNESSVTLSSKASKRSFDELDPEEDEVDGNSPPGSPGAKRTRVD